MPSIILFEPDAVVALDVTQAMAGRQMRVLAARSLTDALRRAAAENAVAALLHAGADALAGMAVPAGLHVVLMGHAAEEGPAIWPVLRRPFSSEDLWQALQPAGLSSPDTPKADARTGA